MESVVFIVVQFAVPCLVCWGVQCVVYRYIQCVVHCAVQCAVQCAVCSLQMFAASGVLFAGVFSV